MNSKDIQVIAFTTITDFIKELKTSLKRKYKPLALFERFLSNVTLTNVGTISNMVQVFRSFLVTNHDCVMTKNIDLLTNKELAYSNNVMINIETTYNLLDEDSKESFWAYLLKIYALVEPSSGAKDVLIEDSKNTSLQVRGGSSPTGAGPGAFPFTQLPGLDLFGNIFQKVNDHLSEKGDDMSDNPIEVLSDMLKSGLFTDILDTMKTKIDNGEINVEALTSTFAAAKFI